MSKVVRVIAFAWSPSSALLSSRADHGGIRGHLNWDGIASFEVFKTFNVSTKATPAPDTMPSATFYAVDGIQSCI